MLDLTNLLLLDILVSTQEQCDAETNKVAKHRQRRQI